MTVTITMTIEPGAAVATGLSTQAGGVGESAAPLPLDALGVAPGADGASRNDAPPDDLVLGAGDEDDQQAPMSLEELGTEPD
jgi:hypothetical protein